MSLKAYKKEKPFENKLLEKKKELLTNKLISLNYNGKIKTDFALSEELFELTEIKYQNLLNALNTGKIDQMQFREWRKNTFHS